VIRSTAQIWAATRSIAVLSTVVEPIAAALIVVTVEEVTVGVAVILAVEQLE
jgi:hypothetical protein